MISLQEVNIILSKVGEKFLQYVINYTGPVESYRFSPIQLQSFVELRNLIAECEVLGSQTPYLSLKFFLFKKGNKFNELRMNCNGGISQKYSENKLLDYLFSKTIEYYACLLLIDDPRDINYNATVNPTNLMSFEPDVNNVISLIQENENLESILSKDKDLKISGINYQLNNSIPVVCFTSFFTSSFILRSFQNCCYRIQYDLLSVLNDIENQFKCLQKIANKETVEISYFCGIYGLRLEGMDEYNLTEKIILRNINEKNNPCTKGTITIASSDTYSKLITGCTLEYKFTAVFTNNIEPVDPESNMVQYNSTPNIQQIEATINNLITARVLSSKSSITPFRFTFIDQDAPLSQHDPRTIENKVTGITIANEKELNEMSNWFVKLNSIDLSHISLTLNRLITSIYNRTNYIDSILDAFIAWESMFGSEISTTNSVIKSIAHMLQRENSLINNIPLDDLYSFRSSIVHGNPQLHKLLKGENPLQNLENIKSEVIRIALKVLEELIKDSTLLNLTPQKRVESLLKPTTIRCEKCGIRKYDFNTT